MYAAFGKRLLDLVVAAACLVALSPVLLLTGLAIRLEDGRPVLFRQARQGRGETTFRIFKFRSMAVDTPEAPSALLTGARVTRVGRVIRRLNLDELPQLLNIARGDMSLVGPRPALPGQSDLVALRSAGGATALRPGLTGLAQVSSFDGMTTEEKAAFDNAYAAHISLASDLRIVARTVPYLVKRPPVY